MAQFFASIPTSAEAPGPPGGGHRAPRRRDRLSDRFLLRARLRPRQRKAASSACAASGGIDERHHLTLMCRDLSEIAKYAIVDDAQFQLMKSATPGSYTFILRARREVAAQADAQEDDRRARAGASGRARAARRARPAHALDHASAPGEQTPLSEADAVRARLEHEVDLVIDAGPCGVEPSTVIDLSGEKARVLREGKGSLAPFAVERV